MLIYFLLIRIAALFGHEKAKKLIAGQAEWKATGAARLSSLKRAVWIHAASVGEFEQARPLIERIRAEQPERKIVLTFFSPSGYEARKNYPLVDAVCYLPFATRRNAKRFLDALEPSMAVFVKYEFWPAYLQALHKRQIPTYIISAIFRPKQLFFLPWGKLHLRMLRCFTHLYVQDEPSRQLLAKYGISRASVAGDTRFDRVKEVQQASGQGKNLTPIALFKEGCTRVLVAGSTWPKDEQLLAQYMNGQRNNGQGTKLILVPHEIDEEHLHFIFNLFQGRYVRYSTLCDQQTACNRQILLHADVLVLDTIGLLSAIYRFGQVAYVGGGFGVGIHNTIEAAVYGVPVIFGPNYHHFREAQGLIDAQAGRSIRNYSELEAALDVAFADYQGIGAKAAAYVQSELGATEKIFKEIF